MASENFKSGEFMDLLDKFFDEQSDAATGKEPSKWFMRNDEGDLEQKLKNVLSELDTEAYEAYLDSGKDEGFDASDGQIKVRLELLFVQSLLAGYRRRYLAGEESKPRSELDSRRYAMYSSRSRKAMLARFRDILEE